MNSDDLYNIFSDIQGKSYIYWLNLLRMECYHGFYKNARFRE